MKFGTMRMVAKATVVFSSVFSVVSLLIGLALYLPEVFWTSGLAKQNTAAIGFWWCLFSCTWSTFLIIPHMAYFLRSNGWCIACCGGRQRYNLASLFYSVIDVEPEKLSHPGSTRPFLSPRAKAVLNILLFALSAIIIVTSFISLICYSAILKEFDGTVWSAVTFTVGLWYLASAAFIIFHMKERDRKRALLAESPIVIKKILKRTEKKIKSRAPMGGSINTTPTDHKRMTEEDSDLDSDFDVKYQFDYHSSKYESNNDNDHARNTAFNQGNPTAKRESIESLNVPPITTSSSSSSYSHQVQNQIRQGKNPLFSSSTRIHGLLGLEDQFEDEADHEAESSDLAPKKNASLQRDKNEEREFIEDREDEEDEEDEYDGLISSRINSTDDRLSDLTDANIVASHFSGHTPFSLSKHKPDSRCNIICTRAVILFCFFLIAMVVMLMLIFQIFATYEAVSMVSDWKLSRKEGQMFYSASNSYHYTLHFWCEGPQPNFLAPTVLIETDIFSVSYEWEEVNKLLTTGETPIRVCRYDRAGYGWSQSGLKPREAKLESDELSHVLDIAKEFGPFVLVSHGYGTFISRIFALRRPQSVSAMMLIDGIHENQQKEYWRALRISVDEGNLKYESWIRTLGRRILLAPIGIPRMEFEPSSQLSAKSQINERAAKTAVAYHDAVWSEAANMYTLSAQETAKTRVIGFGSLPITVIMSQLPINGTCEQNGINPLKCQQFYDDRDSLGDLPMNLQYDILKLSKNNKLVMADNSSGNPHLEQPNFVADQIRDLIKRAYNITF